MGEYQLVYTAIGAIVFVAAIIGGRFIVVTNFLDADIDSVTTTRELNAMSVSYKLLDCMTKDGTVHAYEFLDQHRGESICEIEECGICNIIGEAKVTDLEDTGRTWEFQYSSISTLPQDIKDKVMFWNDESDRKTFSVYLDIDYNGYSHIGRLDVNV